MKIQLADALFEKFPETVQYTVIARNISNKGESKELIAMLRKEEEKIRTSDDFAELKEHPYIASWRDAFTKFNFNPNRCPPSIANLIKRVRSGKDLPFVNKLVCIFNIISLRYTVPAGADNLASLTGNLILGPATGDEEYIPLGGGDVEHPAAGEIILYDSTTKSVFCRAWCWRNSEPSKVTDDATDVSINVDIIPPMPAAQGESAAKDIITLLNQHCGGTAKLIRLDTSNRTENLG